MKKMYNFRLESNLIKQLDLLDGTRTKNVIDALQLYINPSEKNYNVDMFDLLNNQITDLKSDKKYLQDQVNALMVAKLPWLSKIKLKLIENK